MKRQIKFRFWVESANQMSDWETAKKECNRLSLLELDNFIPMQFTGLTDKNGKEIYGGDILGGYPHGTSDVVWEDKHACWCAHWIEQQIDEDGAEFDVDCTSLLATELDNCKDEWTVIGNIYQNPELLKNGIQEKS